MGLLLVVFWVKHSKVTKDALWVKHSKVTKDAPGAWMKLVVYD
jgi:hypothetical protein